MGNGNGAAKVFGDVPQYVRTIGWLAANVGIPTLLAGAFIYMAVYQQNKIIENQGTIIDTESKIATVVNQHSVTSEQEAAERIKELRLQTRIAEQTCINGAKPGEASKCLPPEDR